MTRFARSKGSKASNERVEEEATPWEELKSTIAPPPSKKFKYNVEDIENDDLEKFGEIDFTENNENNSEQSSSDESEAEEEQETTNKFVVIENNEKKVKEKLAADDDVLTSKKKRKRSQNKCLNCKQPGHLKRECPNLSEERRKELQDLVQMKVERKGQGTGRKKNKQKLADKLSQSKDESKDGSTPQAKNNKKAKVLKDKTGQVVNDGEGLFQGFRVLKEDVQRLRDLHAKLEKGKISPNEIKEVLKKERRRAEKSLAKSIKNVCYQCRQPGHVLNDCPQLDLKQNKSKMMGKCFKCGSNEHTSKNCESKLKGADAYRFAECFVCKQTGHLAKACPDNPKGLYPKGGGCRFCGSVEHLKSDCPRKAQKDAKSDVRAMKMNDHKDLEDEPIPSQPKKKFQPQKKQKVVSF